jgi:hypothetical protein
MKKQKQNILLKTFSNKNSGVKGIKGHSKNMFAILITD